MMLNRKILFFLFFILVFKIAECSASINIATSGGWTQVIDQSYLISGPGSPLQSTYESITNATTIDVTGCQQPDEPWLINVKRIDSGWNPNFYIFVKRTSQGNMNGGLDYVLITDNTENFFFSGQGNIYSIFCQYKFTINEGINSLLIPPGTYNTTITYTLL